MADKPAPRKRTQAERVYARFGGVRRLYDALIQVNRKRNLSSIYRWNMPKSHGGSGGVIPAPAMADVELAAKLEGIALAPDDYRPAVL